MSKNKTLSAAKSAKNDEFYTQYADIQKEINAYLDYDPDTFRGKTVLLPCDDPEWSKFTRFFAENFERLGLKKLISTSYAAASKKFFNAETQRRGGGRASAPRTPSWYQPTLFEQESPQFDEKKTAVRGKIFVLDHDTNANGRIDLDDLEWKYLEGDGDFRSEEVCRLRDEADVIVTNPPFSLFREFLVWILGTDGEDNLTQRSGEAESAESVLAAKNAKSAKNGRARTPAAPHGSRYYVFKTKYLDYGPRLDDPFVIARTADFGGRSAKVKKAIEQFKADGALSSLRPRQSPAQPPPRL